MDFNSLANLPVQPSNIAPELPATVEVKPVGYKEWAVIFDGEMIAKTTDKPAADKVAFGLTQAQLVASLYSYIFDLQDTIEMLLTSRDTGKQG